MTDERTKDDFEHPLDGPTTVDGSLVQRFEVDRHTGQMRDIE